MLKKLFILIAMLALPFAVVKAQYNAIHFDLVGVTPAIDGGVLRVGYERTFGSKFSARLSFETGVYRKGLQTIGPLSEQVYSVEGWGIMPELRFYPFTNNFYAPEGLFAGVHYRYRSVEEKYTENTNIKTKGIAHNAGLFVGYKYVYNNFGFEALVGMGGATGTYNTPNDRALISDEFRTELNDLNNAARLEVSVSYVFPKVKRKSDVVTAPPFLDTHSESTDPDSAKMVIVYLYRPDKTEGKFLSYPIFHDNKLIAEAENGFYTKYIVEDLEQVELNVLTRSAHGITFNVQPGRTYFVECNIKRGPLGGSKPVLKVVPATEALPIIEALKAKREE